MKVLQKVGSFSPIAALRHAALIGFSALLLLAWVTPAHANLVTDGTFQVTTLSSPGGYICSVASGQYCTTTALTDWSVSCPNGCYANQGGTPLSLLFPGTNGVAFNNYNGLYGIAPSIVPGNIVADDANSYYQANIYQTISGLTPGGSYVLSFYQAGAQQNGAGGPTDEYWQVSLGSQTQLSPDMTAPQGGYTAWTQQTMTFTATSSSEVLNFLSSSVYNGAPPIALLQDVSLNAATPEPGYLAIMVAGLVAIVVRQRRRRAQTAV